MARPSRRGKYPRPLTLPQTSSGEVAEDGDIEWPTGPFVPPATSLTVEESDGSPSASPVDTIKLDATDFTLTDNGDGSVTVTADEPDAAEHIADSTDAHDASAISIVDTGGYFTATEVEGALAELAANPVTGEDLAALGVRGELLIRSEPSSPLTFDDILQDSEGTALLYAAL